MELPPGNGQYLDLENKEIVPPTRASRSAVKDCSNNMCVSPLRLPKWKHGTQQGWIINFNENETMQILEQKNDGSYQILQDVPESQLQNWEEIFTSDPRGVCGNKFGPVYGYVYVEPAPAPVPAPPSSLAGPAPAPTQLAALAAGRAARRGSIDPELRTFLRKHHFPTKYHKGLINLGIRTFQDLRDVSNVDLRTQRWEMKDLIELRRNIALEEPRKPDVELKEEINEIRRLYLEELDPKWWKKVLILDKYTGIGIGDPSISIHAVGDPGPRIHTGGDQHGIHSAFLVMKMDDKTITVVPEQSVQFFETWSPPSPLTLQTSFKRIHHHGSIHIGAMDFKCDTNKCFEEKEKWKKIRTLLKRLDLNKDDYIDKYDLLKNATFLNNLMEEFVSGSTNTPLGINNYLAPQLVPISARRHYAQQKSSDLVDEGVIRIAQLIYHIFKKNEMKDSEEAAKEIKLTLMTNARFVSAIIKGVRQLQDKRISKYLDSLEENVEEDNIEFALNDHRNAIYWTELRDSIASWTVKRAQALRFTDQGRARAIDSGLRT